MGSVEVCAQPGGMKAQMAEQRRNGASDWRVFRDLTDHDRYVERYIVTSWGEYERLRNRMTMADRALLDDVQAYVEPGTPSRISRLIGVERS